MTPDQTRFAELLDVVHAFIMHSMNAHASPEHQDAANTLLRAGARPRIVIEYDPRKLVFRLVQPDGTATDVFTVRVPGEARPSLGYLN